MVTVAYGDEPWLEESVTASLASVGVAVDVVLVDNGCTDGAVERLSTAEGVTVVRSGGNTGFAGGCNEGAAVALGDILAFVNPDAIVEPGCLAALAGELQAGTTGIATASVRLADAPDRLNSAGNAVHFLGLSWSGAFDELAADHGERREVLAASGACMAMPARVYQELGGFEPEFFAYQEDADLSLRSWQSGRPVVYVPDAVVRHRYEFGRNTGKFYLLDRNRLICVLTVWGTRTLVLLAPLLLGQELAMWLLAAKQGWLAERRRSVAWVLRHRRWLLGRRRRVQSRRVVGDATIAPHFAVALDPGNLETPAVLDLATPLLAGYWSLVRRLL